MSRLAKCTTDESQATVCDMQSQNFGVVASVHVVVSTMSVLSNARSCLNLVVWHNAEVLAA